MAQHGGRLEQFTAHHEALVGDVVDHRDAVLDPTSDFDCRDNAEYLRETVLPHASREEELLSSRVDGVVGSEVATAGLRAEHDELERRIDALEAREPDGASLPLALHEFTALFEQHSSKEGAVLLPFLRNEMERDDFESLLDSLLDSHAHEWRQPHPVELERRSGPVTAPQTSRRARPAR